MIIACSCVQQTLDLTEAVALVGKCVARDVFSIREGFGVLCDAHSGLHKSNIKIRRTQALDNKLTNIKHFVRQFQTIRTSAPNKPQWALIGYGLKKFLRGSGLHKLACFIVEN